MITEETIKAARAGDLDATTAIIKSMDRHVTAISRRAAGWKGRDFARFADEFRATANVALWEAVNKFPGETVKEFFSYAYRSIDYRVTEEARGFGDESEADRRLMSTFAAAVERADGDIHLAEKLSQIHAYTKRGRLSADAAHAARLKWQGTAYLDRSCGTSEGGRTLGDSVASSVSGPDEADDIEMPNHNPNKIKAAYRLLLDYVVVPSDALSREGLGAALEMLSMGAVSVAAIEAVTECVTVPKDRAARMAVLGAVGILSRATEDPRRLTATPDDDYEVTDEENPEARATVARAQTVRAIVSGMVDNYRLILTHTYGLVGEHAHGRGEACDYDSLSAATGIPNSRINDLQNKAHTSFGKRWIKAMAVSLDHAKALEDAMRSRSRKKK